MASSSSLATLKPYAIPLVAVMVVGICVPLVIMPGYSNIQTKMADISAYEEVKSALQQKLTTLQAMDTAAHKALLQSSLELAIPASPDAAGLMAQMERIAQEVGVTLQGARYTPGSDEVPAGALGASESASAAIPKVVPAATDMPLRNVSVSLTLTGTFPQVYNFASKTESSLRLNSISQFSIIEEDAGSDRVIAQFDIQAPYIANLTDLGVVSTMLPEVQVSGDNPTIVKLKKMSVSSFSTADPKTITGRDNPFK